MNDLREKQWTRWEVVYVKTTTIVFSSAVVILPFLTPLDVVHSSPTPMVTYEQLGSVFPYLAWSLPFTSDPAFYVVSKLVLFASGFALVLSIGVIPLSQNIKISDYQVILDAKRALLWFWLLFAVSGYGLFFWMYSSGMNLSWASKAAVGSPLGIAIGNFAQFGVFALLALYVLLIRQYFRLRSVWGIANGGKESRSA